jgi:hypothetical protein
MSFEFRLATNADDQELRELLKEVEMSGHIALSFEREPNYFMASDCANLKSETMLVVEKESDEIVGVGSRATRYCYLDGHKTKIGYLSNLRGKKEVRNALLLARGYRFLKKLYQKDKVPFYISTIFSDNTIAQNILTSQRAGLPIYQEIGKITTGFISLLGRSKTLSVQVVRLTESIHTIEEMVDFLNGYNAKLQYAPYYRVEDFVGKEKLLGVSIDELYLYLKEGKIVGLMGAWNQTSFKQVKVNSYSRSYQLMRPFYNLFAKLKGVPPLPPVGSYIQNIYGSFVAITDDDATVFHALVDAIKEHWAERGYSYMAIGFHEKHPLHKELLRCSSQRLESLLYEVFWDEKSISFDNAFRVPHVEIATL